MVYGKDEMMIFKVMGAILIILGCGGVGFSLCQNHRREEAALEQLIHSLEWMRLELSYRMPALPSLCKEVAGITEGIIGDVFRNFALELDQQIRADVLSCMNAAIFSVPKLPTSVVSHLKSLGTSLGQFDLQGQITALETAEALCKRDLLQLNKHREIKFRNYQVLGLCAGAAMVLLFL